MRLVWIHGREPSQFPTQSPAAVRSLLGAGDVVLWAFGPRDAREHRARPRTPPPLNAPVPLPVSVHLNEIQSTTTEAQRNLFEDEGVQSSSRLSKLSLCRPCILQIRGNHFVRELTPFPILIASVYLTSPQISKNPISHTMSFFEGARVFLSRGN